MWTERLSKLEWIFHPFVELHGIRMILLHRDELLQCDCTLLLIFNFPWKCLRSQCYGTLHSLWCCCSFELPITGYEFLLLWWHDAFDCSFLGMLLEESQSDMIYMWVIYQLSLLLLFLEDRTLDWGNVWVVEEWVFDEAMAWLSFLPRKILLQFQDSGLFLLTVVPLIEDGTYLIGEYLFTDQLLILD